MDYNSFTLFPSLPLELRLIIWQLALPAPRCVVLESAIAKARIPPPGCMDCTILWKLRCIENAPSMFFVCKESQVEILKTYRPYKGSWPGSGKIYVDSSKDLFCVPRIRNVDPPTCIIKLAKMVEPKIRRLAIGSRDNESEEFLAITWSTITSAIAKHMDLEEGQLFVTDMEPKEGNSHLLGTELACSESFSQKGLRSAEALNDALYDREEWGIDEEDYDWSPPECLIANWILGKEIVE